MTEKQKAYITAVGNRCSISDRDNPCLNCASVQTAVDYIAELETETRKWQMEWEDARRDLGKADLCWAAEIAKNKELVARIAELEAESGICDMEYMGFLHDPLNPSALFRMLLADYRSSDTQGAK